MSADNYRINPVIYPIFFLSGFPALIYQVIWQRALFTIYGVNIESITLVVAVFMAGLGLGSLLGGWISRNPRVPVLAVFGFTELTIGLFGLISLRLFDFVGSLTLNASLPKAGLATFLMLLLPTLLMGATLPLLVAYLVRSSSNVGRSTGSLYFVNTLGSSAASFCAALFLLKLLGKQGSISVAASINMFVAASAFYFHMRKGDKGISACPRGQVAAVDDNKTYISFLLALILVFLSGYIALSYEIVWIRVFTIGFAGSAATFPLVLGMYLAGVAWGSLEAKRFCPDSRLKKRDVSLQTLAIFIVFANVLGFLLIPLISDIFQYTNFMLALPAVLPATACLGVTLPLVSHMAIPPDDNAGARLSYLYLSNIVGSTMGSYVTGFVLIDHLLLRSIAVVLLLTGSAMGILLMNAGPAKKTGSIIIGAFVILLSMNANVLYDHVYERLLYRTEFGNDKRFSHVVENKSGVIMVSADGTVFGEGVYDGCFNTDLVNDSNGIFRAYSISAFHRHPRQVLMVGLSSGSWAQVIANNPAVEKLTIVEINPGYLELIRQYPVVSSLLKNAKVEIIIDDGRRWLNRNKERRFDVIVMNTTFHWRAFASNLLSVEFLHIAREHLRRGGVLFYNTTDSPEAQRTGAVVFPYAYRLWNFLIVSDSPIALDKTRWETVLREYRIDGAPVLDLAQKEHRERLKTLLSLIDTIKEKKTQEMGMESRESILARTRGVRLITDDNMITEWAALGI